MVCAACLPACSLAECAHGAHSRAQAVRGLPLLILSSPIPLCAHSTTRPTLSPITQQQQQLHAPILHSSPQQCTMHRAAQTDRALCTSLPRAAHAVRPLSQCSRPPQEQAGERAKKVLKNTFSPSSTHLVELHHHAQCMQYTCSTSEAACSPAPSTQHPPRRAPPRGRGTARATPPPGRRAPPLQTPLSPPPPQTAPPPACCRGRGGGERAAMSQSS